MTRPLPYGVHAVDFITDIRALTEPYYLAQYAGTSLISAAIMIRQWDWSVSHSAYFRTRDCYVQEAWKSGVREVPHDVDHTDGTYVHIYRVDGLSSENGDMAWDFGRSQLGKPYDWWGIIRFLTRPDRPDHWQAPPRWFCSRLVAAQLRIADITVQQMPTYKHMPATLSASPLTHYVGTLIC